MSEFSNNLNQTEIHPWSVVHPQAQIGVGVQIGPFAVVEADVLIGDRCQLASHVLIASGTRLGADCRVSNGAVLGTPPQDLKFTGEPSELRVGERTVIREFATLNRATHHGGGVTQVGADCMLMAYSHVAHDCQLGNNVIIANAVNMAGHVTIEDFASLGGMTVLHQFVKVGKYAFIGGRSRVSQDVPPYALISGEPIGYYGPNVIGLRRKGFSPGQIEAIKKTYQFIYNPKLNITQALEAIRAEMEITPEVQLILDFIAKSERGLTGK